MTAPTRAFRFERLLDPTDIECFEVELTQGSDDTDILDPGEGVASYALTVSDAAEDVGVAIKTDAGYETTLVGNTIRFWLEVAEDDQDDAAFNVLGLDVEILLTFETTSTPPRKKQRTLIVRAVNQ